MSYAMVWHDGGEKRGGEGRATRVVAWCGFCRIVLKYSVKKSQSSLLIIYIWYYTIYYVRVSLISMDMFDPMRCRGGKPHSVWWMELLSRRPHHTWGLYWNWCCESFASNTWRPCRPPQSQDLPCKQSNNWRERGVKIFIELSPLTCRAGVVHPWWCQVLKLVQLNDEEHLMGDRLLHCTS